LENISNILSGFSPVGLTELDQVALLDRMDTKYVFSLDRLPFFLTKLSDHYFILDINGNRMFHYNSLYFDTEGFHLFNLHASGRANRYKVRCRRYVESGLVYFEIKFKNNKGRTIKSRVMLNSENEIDDKALELLNEKTPFSIDDLKAMIWVNYVRITLVSKDFKERLTIDLDLSFKRGGEYKSYNNLVIAELKQNRSCSSVFSKLMKEHHIRTGSLSKYCFGIASMYSEVKKNNFKYQFLSLNKIINAPATSFRP
jgi:hypothetical protein